MLSSAMWARARSVIAWGMDRRWSHGVRLGLIASAVAGAVGCAHVEPVKPRDWTMPPMTTEGETAMAALTPLADRCLSQAKATADPAGGRLGPPLLTANRRWGEVWRADVRYDDLGVQRASRIVCWRPSGAQDVTLVFAPLPKQPAPMLRPRVR